MMHSATCSPVVHPSPSLFTGKERDAESGNDYFGARYYSSAMGRFMSPDWSATPAAVPFADPADPQTLNQYSYVKNNPLNRTDPNGHNWFDVNGKWSWHEGDTWKDGKNTYTSKYTGLLVATQTGTDKKKTKIKTNKIKTRIPKFFPAYHSRMRVRRIGWSKL